MERTALIPLLITLAYALLALLPDLRAVRFFPAIPAAIVALLAVALFMGRTRPPRWSARTILVLAALFRAAMVLRPPELSDDIYRYLWDGQTLRAGTNPYAAAPADGPDTPLRALVNHPELVTIYPPVAELLFSLGCSGARAMKGLLATIDLATCALLLVILRRLGLPAWRAALYAWHPLPVIEVAGSGHIDGAAVFFLAVSIAMCGRRALAGCFFALAAWTKLFPAVFLPCVFPRSRARAFIIATAATSAALVLPFFPEIKNGLGTLSTYAHRWEFAGFTFRVLRTLTGSGGWARVLVLLAFVGVIVWGLRTLRGSEPRRALEVAYLFAIAFLVLTPTLHAWYALYLAFLLPFAAGPGGLALSATVFLGYAGLPHYVATGEWRDPLLLAAAITLLPLFAAVAARRLRHF